MNLKAIYNDARRASTGGGKSVILQILDIVKLRLGPTKLGADDYYLYELYKNHYSFRDKSKFLGWRASETIDRILNLDEWREFANDKLKFHIKMSENGFRTPKIKAIFHDRHLNIPDIKQLTTAEEAEVFLLNSDIYPVFMKPVHGTYGRGGFSVLSVCKETKSLKIGNGTKTPVSDVVKKFGEKWTNGYIIQELLTPHPEVEALVGQRLSSVRVIVLRINDKPHIFRAVWKLPTGNNMSDNFMHGELGNLIANVNPSNGNVTNVVGKVNGRIDESRSHPDTGCEISGLSVPMWTQIVQYCESASDLFPGLSMQHWDIAICPEGPNALELNVEGSLDLHQLAARSGVYTDELINALRLKR